MNYPFQKSFFEKVVSIKTCLPLLRRLEKSPNSKSPNLKSPSMKCHGRIVLQSKTPYP